MTETFKSQAIRDFLISKIKNDEFKVDSTGAIIVAFPNKSEFRICSGPSGITSYHLSMFTRVPRKHIFDRIITGIHWVHFPSDLIFGGITDPLRILINKKFLEIEQEAKKLRAKEYENYLKFVSNETTKDLGLA
jgi:hypothetical protein